MKRVTIAFDINAHIMNVTSEIGRDGDQSKAFISFDNLGDGVITAVKFNAVGMNSFGDIIQVGGKNSFYLIIQDIRIDMNSSATNLSVKLPNSDIRRLELEECQICYADGSVTTYSGKNIHEFEVETFEPESDSDKDTLEAIRDVVSKRIINFPKEDEHGWVCCCGRFNVSDAQCCSSCRIKKVDAFKITESEYVSSVTERHKKNEIERKEFAKVEKEKKEKATKKRNLTIGFVAVFLIAFLVLISRSIVLAGRTTYSSQAEMEKALQGTYTYYNAYGDASRQIVIEGNKATYKWSYSGSYDMETTISGWNYRNGKIHTFEDLVITKQGNLKDGDDIYEKGGYIFPSEGTEPRNSYENGYSVLQITADSLTSNSSYTVCTGSVKNNGTRTYKFIEVKGAFEDSNGNVIDTDWTYAAGSEGLAPGESTTFRLSVTKNYKVTSCTVSLLDFD